jgi:hypothetical protein
MQQSLRRKKRKKKSKLRAVVMVVLLSAPLFLRYGKVGVMRSYCSLCYFTASFFTGECAKVTELLVW